MAISNTPQTMSGAGADPQLLDYSPRDGILQRLWGFAKKKPVGAVSGVIILVTVVTAVLSYAVPGILPHDPLEFPHDKYQPPLASGLMGSDHLGRDEFSRIIAGTQVSIYVGVLSVGIGVTLGTLIGILSAYIGGVFDLSIQRVVDSMMAFPPIILALGLVAAVGRLREQHHRGAGRDTVARHNTGDTLPGVEHQGDGLYPLRNGYRGGIHTHHAAPYPAQRDRQLHSAGYHNTGFPPSSSRASLSFLGVGIPPDVPTWGTMLTQGADEIRIAWWLAVFPGVAISVVVFSINFVGDALRDVLDPRLRGR